jgi:hypothetical protein
MSGFELRRCVLLAAAIGLIGLPSRGEEPTVGENKIEQALNAPTQVDFVETPLQDVIEFLKDFHKIEIQFDTKALGEAGIDHATPITKNFKGISLRSALRLLLGELNLTYVVRDEVLSITTPQQAAQMLSTRVYPIGDLAIASATPLSDGTSGGYGPHVVRDESLDNLIRTTVEPKSWNVSGGPGTLAVISLDSKRVIVVYQTYAVHRQIRALLDSLRELAGKPEAAKPERAKPEPKPAAG